MNILIFGNGWLGAMLAKAYGADIFPGRLEQVTADDLRPYDVVINTAAKTSIDWCEENKAEALACNAIYAATLADLCDRQDIRYVYISSACIFESADEMDVKYETSAPNPKCFYAVTKWVGEELVKEAHSEALIVRIRLPLSEVPHPRNTINKIVTYKELVNTEESVTILEDFVPALKEMIDEHATGTYHMVNAGTITMPEIVSFFHNDFSVIDRYTLRERTQDAGKANRVSTIVGSKRIPLLPNVQDRIFGLVKMYKSHI